MIYGEQFNILEDVICKGSSCILTGPKGIGKATSAKLYIQKYLDTTNLSANCDYMEVEHMDKDTVQQIITAASTYPTYGKKRVILIDCEISVEDQNRLLKVIEDKQSNVMFILITNRALQTIKSRLQTIHFSPLTDTVMKQYLKDNSVEDGEIAFWLSLCNGSIGVYHTLQQDDGFLKALKSILNYLEAGEYDEYSHLCVYHAYKEKDKENFFENYSEYLPQYFNVLQIVFQQLFYTKHDIFFESPLISYDTMLKRIEELDDILKLIDQEEQINKTHSSYGKNEFFLFICRLGKLLKN